jgi:hypothetical protein
MKQILLIFSFITFSLTVFSQQNGDYNYSIAVRGFSYTQMPKILNQSNSNNYLKSYFNGAMIKFNDNQFSYRISGNYLTRSDEFFNNCNNCELVKGNLKDYAFKLGFEKNLTYTAVQPYFAIDLGYRYNRFTGTSVVVNADKLAAGGQGSAAIPVSSIIATKEGFTITPVLGIKFSPVKQISIFAETNLEFFYSYERQDAVTQDAANTRTLNKYNKGEYLINPVSVGIQFHFVNKN